MDEWLWSNGGMILTRENWSNGRKILYSVGGRWMNEYGAMVEWYWQGKPEVLGEKHYTAWVVDEWVWSNGGMLLTGETEVLGEKHYTAWVVVGWMSMEQWWNDTDRCNWSTGSKTFYSVGGRWIDDYGAMVDWYWQRKLKYWEKNILQCGW